MKLSTAIVRRAIALSCAATLLACGLARAADDPQTSARNILDATGIQGGLIVHIGCGDGRLTAALRASDGYLVHALDSNAQNVAAARKHVRDAGLYGAVSVDTLAGNRLPYATNLVNLVVSEDLGDISMKEVLRVLVPGGVAYIKRDAAWTETVKLWPTNIDEWTHFLHGPDNNAVAHDDVVDVPRRMKWLGRPKFARAHEQAASFTACVTTAGRLFYIVDEAPTVDIRLRSKWSLVARDAFNGVVLWKRPITKWIDQMRRFRSGPAEMAFRLVAKDDRVYVTLGLEAPVSILDAASGKTLATCENTVQARQIMRLGERLIVMVDTAPIMTAKLESQIRRGLKPSPGERSIVVADAVTGKTVWRKKIATFIHPTLAAQGDRLFYQTKEHLICLDLTSGREVWQTERPLSLKGNELGWESPTLVVHGKIVYCADFKTIGAYRVSDGSLLWKAPVKSGYNAPPDVFVIDDLVWLKSRRMTALDPNTGQVKKSLKAIGGYMHPRCYRNKATDRFFLLGNQGVQFVNRASGDVSLHHWLRGTCQYGILPANGLLYITPDSCACNMKSKLPGLWAIESDPAGREKIEIRAEDRLVPGPAYGKIDPLPPVDAAPHPWPVYRHDTSRSGITAAVVGSKLAPSWKTNVGGKLSGVTVADGKLLVASVDTHTVHALDMASGKKLWSFTAGSRVDSPPTIYGGMALFGCADGWVYALRASDGVLAWRYLVAPEQKLVFVNGQLESPWPVHGSVIVKNHKLIAAAGRSSYLDGGIRVVQLTPATGLMVSETVLYSPDPKTGKQPVPKLKRDVFGVLSDILVTAGDDVYMRHAKIDLKTGDHTQSGPHLFSPIGLLDDTWWHRAYWLVNRQFVSHWSGWYKAGNMVPSGRILSYNAASIFGYGRDKYPSGNTGQWRGGERYHLFAVDRSVQPAPKNIPTKKPRGKKKKRAKPTSPNYRWTTMVPLLTKAMLVADRTLFIAGPPDVAKTKAGNRLNLSNAEDVLNAWNNNKGGLLWAVDINDGKRLAAYPLDSPPVFDGMAATSGRLYIATADGHVLCMSGR